MSEINYAAGLYFNKPHEKAPDFVLGSISVKPGTFAEWLAQQNPNEKGYVRLQVKQSKAGNIYVALDDWKPEAGSQRGPVPDTADVDFDEEIPF